MRIKPLETKLNEEYEIENALLCLRERRARLLVHQRKNHLFQEYSVSESAGDFVLVSF